MDVAGITALFVNRILLDWGVMRFLRTHDPDPGEGATGCAPPGDAGPVV